LPFDIVYLPRAFAIVILDIGKHYFVELVEITVWSCTG